MSSARIVDSETGIEISYINNPHQISGISLAGDEVSIRVSKKSLEVTYHTGEFQSISPITTEKFYLKGKTVLFDPNIPTSRKSC